MEKSAIFDNFHLTNDDSKNFSVKMKQVYSKFCFSINKIFRPKMKVLIKSTFQLSNTFKLFKCSRKNDEYL